MPEITDVKMLQELIKEYDENPDWQLFLWKDDDILGAVGVRFEGDDAVIQHVSVNPSHRNLGIGKRMIHCLLEQFCESYHVCATASTEAFVERCESESSSTQL